MDELECLKIDMLNLELDKPTLFGIITQQCPSQFSCLFSDECEDECEQCWEKALGRKINW